MNSRSTSSRSISRKANSLVVPQQRHENTNGAVNPFREVSMRKSQILGGSCFVVVAALILWQDCVGPRAAKDELYARFAHWLGETLFPNEELNAHRVALQRFVTAADAAEAAVFAGRLNLRQAVERIRRASQEHFGRYLDHVARLE